MEIKVMQTRHQHGETLNTRGRQAHSTPNKGYLDFELTQSQVQAVQQCLPQTFFLINPHNGDLDRMKKTIMGEYFVTENANMMPNSWALGNKQKMKNGIENEKQVQMKKKKKKQEHETLKIQQGHKKQIIKNKTMAKKKNLKAIHINSESLKQENSQTKRNNQRIQIEENQVQQESIKQPELLLKQISNSKQIHMFYENQLQSKYPIHPQNALLQMMHGEHFFQYRPIRSLSSGLPRFIPPQENEQRQPQPQTDTNSLKYLFGLPITATKQESLPKLNEKQKNFCYNLLHKLKAHRSSLGFRVPVDPQSQGIPDYFNVIYNPMDLQTITKKVMKDKYKQIYEFHADINQIFLNSYKYNPRETIYFEAAIDFEDYYHYLLHDAEQRPEEYSKQILFKNSKVKRVQNFGELEFTEPTPPKKNMKKDGTIKMKKKISVDIHNNLHPQFPIMQDEYKSLESDHMEYINPSQSNDLENGIRKQSQPKRVSKSRITNQQQHNVEPTNSQNMKANMQQHNYEYHHGLMYAHQDMNQHNHQNQQIQYLQNSQPQLNERSQPCQNPYLIYPQYYHQQMAYPMEIMENQNIYQNRQNFRNENLLKNGKQRNTTSANNDDYNDDDFNIFQENFKKDTFNENAIQSQIMEQSQNNEQKRISQKQNKSKQNLIKPQEKTNKKIIQQPINSDQPGSKINTNQHPAQYQQSIIADNVNPNFTCGTNNFEVILQPSTGPSIGSNVGPIVSSKKIISRAPKQRKKQSSQDEQFMENSRKNKNGKNREKIKKAQSNLESSQARIPKKRGRQPKNKDSITEEVQGEAPMRSSSQNQRFSHSASEQSEVPRERSVRDSDNNELLEFNEKNKNEKISKESNPLDIFIGDSSRQVGSDESHQINFDGII